MLADDRISEIKSGDSITFEINGQKIIRTQFWKINSKCSYITCYACVSSICISNGF